MELSQYDQIRMFFFFGILAIMAVFELLAPRRKLQKSKAKRWFSNILLTFTSSGFSKLLLPFTGVSAAVFAQGRAIGFFNNSDVSPWLAALFFCVIADFVIYWQHVLFHRVPILWSLHKVHHADPDYDVTTGARFHPIEIYLSMVIKILLILALGAPVFAVVLFEIILNGMAMFNHANIKIPEGVDKLLRKMLVTPDFHRVHHSSIPREHQSNFGFNFSIWDYLFRTYKSQPKLGHEQMDVGLKFITDESYSMNFIGMLVTPFKRSARK